MGVLKPNPDSALRKKNPDPTEVPADPDLQGCHDVFLAYISVELAYWHCTMQIICPYYLPKKIEKKM